MDSAAAAIRAMAMLRRQPEALQGCDGGIRTGCVHPHGHIAPPPGCPGTAASSGAAHGVEHPGERMRNCRANFASISAAQHDELIYNRQNHKEDKDIYASGKQEVQPIDGRMINCVPIFGHFLMIRT